MARNHLLYLSGVIALALLLTGVCRGRAVNYPFVWDDREVIRPSAELSGQGLAAVPRVFHLRHWLHKGGPSLRPYRPVRDLAFLLSHRLSHGRPSAYHLVNILVHALNALMVLWLAWLVLGNLYAAGVACLIFAAHPVHTEAVAYAKNIAEILALFFGLLSACLFVHWTRMPPARRRRGPLLLAAAVAALILALLSKESAVCLPPVLFVWCMMLPKKEVRRRGLRALVPMLLIAAAYAGLQFHAASAMDEEKPFALRSVGLSPGTRSEFVGRTVAAYLRALFLPSPPSPWRDLPPPGQANPFMVGLFILAALVLVAFLAATLLRRERLLFGLWWLLFALGPASNLLAYNPRRTMAEQRLYVPSVGYALLIGAVCAALLRERRDARVRAGVLALCGLSVFGFAALSLQSTSVWRHRLALWRQAVRQSPTTGSAHYNLGIIHQNAGFHAGAIRHYRNALRCGNTREEKVWLNIGAALLHLRRYYDARDYFRRAAQREPTDQKAARGLARATYNIAVLFKQRNDSDKALALYRSALRHDPAYSRADANIGRILQERGDLHNALIHFKSALRHSEPVLKMHLHSQIGAIYVRQGRHDLAIRHLRTALELGSRCPRTCAILGTAYARKGALRRADAQYRQALREAKNLLQKSPESAAAATAMATVLEAMGRKPDARRWYAAALQINPDEPEALKNLGRIYAAEPQPSGRDAGIGMLEKACRILTDDVEARVALAHALEAAGQKSKAVRVWHEVLRLNPEHEQAIARTRRPTHAPRPKPRAE